MRPDHSKERLAHWVVVANEGGAVIYTRSGHREPLLKREHMENDMAHLRSGDINSDRDGRTFDSHGCGRHGLGKELHGPRQQATAAFAKRLATRIEAGRQASEFHDYTLVAAPRFLGALRGALTRTSCPAPRAVVNKDVTNRDTTFVDDLLRRH